MNSLLNNKPSPNNEENIPSKQFSQLNLIGKNGINKEQSVNNSSFQCIPKKRKFLPLNSDNKDKNNLLLGSYLENTLSNNGFNNKSNANHGKYTLISGFNWKNYNGISNINNSNINNIHNYADNINSNELSCTNEISTSDSYNNINSNLKRSTCANNAASNKCNILKIKDNYNEDLDFWSKTVNNNSKNNDNEIYNYSNNNLPLLEEEEISSSPIITADNNGVNNLNNFNRKRSLSSNKNINKDNNSCSSQILNKSQKSASKSKNALLRYCSKEVKDNDINKKNNNKLEEEIEYTNLTSRKSKTKKVQFSSRNNVLDEEESHNLQFNNKISIDNNNKDFANQSKNRHSNFSLKGYQSSSENDFKYSDYNTSQYLNKINIKNQKNYTSKYSNNTFEIEEEANSYNKDSDSSILNNQVSSKHNNIMEVEQEKKVNNEILNSPDMLFNESRVSTEDYTSISNYNIEIDYPFSLALEYVDNDKEIKKKMRIKDIKTVKNNLLSSLSIDLHLRNQGLYQKLFDMYYTSTNNALFDYFYFKCLEEYTYYRLFKVLLLDHILYNIKSRNNNIEVNEHFREKDFNNLISHENKEFLCYLHKRFSQYITNTGDDISFEEFSFLNSKSSIIYSNRLNCNINIVDTVDSSFYKGSNHNVNTYETILGTNNIKQIDIEDNGLIDTTINPLKWISNRQKNKNKDNNSTCNNEDIEMLDLNLNIDSSNKINNLNSIEKINNKIDMEELDDDEVFYIRDFGIKKENISKKNKELSYSLLDKLNELKINSNNGNNINDNSNSNSNISFLNKKHTRKANNFKGTGNIKQVNSYSYLESCITKNENQNNSMKSFSSISNISNSNNKVDFNPNIIYTSKLCFKDDFLNESETNTLSLLENNNNINCSNSNNLIHKSQIDNIVD